MEDSQEARTWWKQWIWVEKLIFPVSVTQKEQLSGVFIFDFEKSAFLAHPNEQVQEALEMRSDFTKLQIHAFKWHWVSVKESSRDFERQWETMRDIETH